MNASHSQNRNLFTRLSTIVHGHRDLVVMNHETCKCDRRFGKRYMPNACVVMCDAMCRYAQ